MNREADRMLLEVDSLSVSYDTERGELQALRDVTIDVPRGEIVGIVGESGCGKSTLISAIIRLISPNARLVGGEHHLAADFHLQLAGQFGPHNHVPA